MAKKNLKSLEDLRKRIDDLIPDEPSEISLFDLRDKYRNQYRASLPHGFLENILSGMEAADDLIIIRDSRPDGPFISIPTKRKGLSI